MAGKDRPALSVTAAEVRALRVKAHRLDQRVMGKDALSQVAGTCGLQDSPPGAATTAFHARVADLTPAVLERALAIDRTLVRTWAMRGAPHVVPTADLSVFTTGVLPVDEEARTRLIQGVRQALDGLTGHLDDIAAATADAVPRVLAGRQLDVHELGRQVAERIGATLPQGDRAVWNAEGPYSEGQPLGEAVVHFCLRILTLQQIVCFAPRQGGKAPFVLVSEWLHDVPQLSASVARRELVTRYLRAFGPSTATALAAWLGVVPSDARAWWDLVKDDVVPIDVDGSCAWLLAEDLATLEASEDGTVHGVRLLPPSDPFLQPADRELLVSDREQQRRLWRSPHSPGALLVDGHVVGTWRGRTRSSRLDITVVPFRHLSSAARSAIHDEAQALGRLRGVKHTTVGLGDS